MPQSSTLGRSLAFFTTRDNYTFSFGGLIAAHRLAPFQNTSNGPCEAALAEITVPILMNPYRTSHDQILKVLSGIYLLVLLCCAHTQIDLST